MADGGGVVSCCWLNLVFCCGVNATVKAVEAEELCSKAIDDTRERPGDSSENRTSAGSAQLTIEGCCFARSGDDRSVVDDKVGGGSWLSCS